MTPDDPLTQILYTLQDARQRATYGAVAGVLNAFPRSLMQGRDRDPLHSWVVSQSDGQPTGYQDDQRHAELFANDHVIDSADELAAWLDARA